MNWSTVVLLFYNVIPTLLYSYIISRSSFFYHALANNGFTAES